MRDAMVWRVVSCGIVSWWPKAQREMKSGRYGNAWSQESTDVESSVSSAWIGLFSLSLGSSMMIGVFSEVLFAMSLMRRCKSSQDDDQVSGAVMWWARCGGSGMVLRMWWQ